MHHLCKRCFTKLRNQEIVYIEGVFTIIDKSRETCSDCYTIWYAYIAKIKLENEKFVKVMCEKDTNM